MTPLINRERLTKLIRLNYKNTCKNLIMKWTNNIRRRKSKWNINQKLNLKWKGPKRNKNLRRWKIYRRIKKRWRRRGIRMRSLMVRWSRRWAYQWICKDNFNRSQKIKMSYKNVIRSYGRGKGPFRKQASSLSLEWKAIWGNLSRKSNSSRLLSTQNVIS